MDSNAVLLSTVLSIKSDLGGVCKQLDGLDAKIEKLGDEVSRHGKWIFAANIVLVILIGVVGFAAKAFWDVILVRLNTPPSPLP